MYPSRHPYSTAGDPPFATSDLSTSRHLRGLRGLLISVEGQLHPCPPCVFQPHTTSVSDSRVSYSTLLTETPWKTGEQGRTWIIKSLHYKHVSQDVNEVYHQGIFTYKMNVQKFSKGYENPTQGVFVGSFF